MKPALIIGILSYAAFAQEPQTLTRCMQGASTQLAMNECAQAEVLRSQDELDGLYNRVLVMVRAEPGARQKVETERQAWLAYREAHIEAMYPARDKQLAYGSMYPLEVALLRAKLTRQQIAAVREFIKQPEPR